MELWKFRTSDLKMKFMKYERSNIPSAHDKKPNKNDLFWIRGDAAIGEVGNQERPSFHPLLSDREIFFFLVDRSLYSFVIRIRKLRFTGPRSVEIVEAFIPSSRATRPWSWSRHSRLPVFLRFQGRAA